MFMQMNAEPRYAPNTGPTLLISGRTAIEYAVAASAFRLRSGMAGLDGEQLRF